MEGAGNAGALERLVLELLTASHETGHLNLSELDLLAAEVREGLVRNVVRHLSVLRHLVCVFAKLNGSDFEVFRVCWSSVWIIHLLRSQPFSQPSDREVASYLGNSFKYSKIQIFLNLQRCANNLRSSAYALYFFFSISFPFLSSSLFTRLVVLALCPRSNPVGAPLP